MTIQPKHGNLYQSFCAAIVLMVLFTTALVAACLSGDEPRTIRFELRLASMEKVNEWNGFPGPGPLKAPVWISPEVILTNTDVAKAWVQNTGDKFEVGILLTEEGALKLARLTKSHVGENVAVMINGRITAIPKIMAEITGGRAVIQGNFTEEEARLVAEGITAQ